MIHEPRTKTRLKSKPEDQNSKTAQLAKTILEIGPDINKVSRRLEQFKESVRYRYKTKLLDKGFVVQAAVDHEKLGLRRVFLIAEFAPGYKSYANTILSAMNELCYVVYFERRTLTDDYAITASVPSEFVQSFIAFMTKLKEKGIFTNLEAVAFDRFRVIPMQTQYYDFNTGLWDYDWSSPREAKRGAADTYMPSEKVDFDGLDLFILKELQMDSSRSLTEMATKLKQNYKTVTWHYRTHVLGKRMVNGYYLRWMGTSYSTSLERALHRKHRYQHIILLAKELNQVERMELMAKLHGIPFMWSEMAGKNEYFTEFYFPTENLTDAFEFLGMSMSGIKGKTSVMIMDQTEALSFTFSYQLFDEEANRWTFNEPMLLARFDSLVAQIREVGRT
jgi:hypothetical protein